MIAEKIELKFFLQVGLVWDTDTGTKQHMVREPVYDCQVILAPGIWLISQICWKELISIMP